jgi:hypothetical protein
MIKPGAASDCLSLRPHPNLTADLELRAAVVKAGLFPVRPLRGNAVVALKQRLSSRLERECEFEGLALNLGSIVVVRSPGQSPGTDLNLCVVPGGLRKPETTPRCALIMQQTPFLWQRKGRVREQELGGRKAAGICFGMACSGSEESDLHAARGRIPALEPTGQIPPLCSETGMGAVIFGELKAARTNRFKFGRRVLNGASSQNQGRRRPPHQGRRLDRAFKKRASKGLSPQRR